MVIGWTENDDEQPPSDEQPKARAAIYVRMSTEHQKYSTDNQIAAIERYAAKRRFEIAWTHADEGKSARYLGRVPKDLGASEGSLGNRSLHVAGKFLTAMFYLAVRLVHWFSPLMQAISAAEHSATPLTTAQCEH
ncbi:MULTISPECIES: recombinase family protein [unclassified Ensifer]|uniref:recombinase family protein n=1 Tax=unclassified Ensifer TaxID=2633371 RepID=UPI00300FAEE2